jgi:hypothetical protein
MSFRRQVTSTMSRLRTIRASGLLALMTVAGIFAFSAPPVFAASCVGLSNIQIQPSVSQVVPKGSTTDFFTTLTWSNLQPGTTITLSVVSNSNGAWTITVSPNMVVGVTGSGSSTVDIKVVAPNTANSQTTALIQASGSGCTATVQAQLTDSFGTSVPQFSAPVALVTAVGLLGLLLVRRKAMSPMAIQ